MDLILIVQLVAAFSAGVLGHYSYSMRIAPKRALKRMHRERAAKAVATKRAKKAVQQKSLSGD